jgi:hypothetical protein
MRFIVWFPAAAGEGGLLRQLGRPRKTMAYPTESAWSGLYRWYNTFGYPRHRPMKVSAESISRFFGSTCEFLTRFTRFLRGREMLHESLHRDEIAGF